jgi:uncharacterized protein (TIGR02117 family)
MKRILLLISAPIMLLIFIILLYFIVAFGLLLFPTNSDSISANQNNSNPETTTVEAYISSNGVHTDFIFPTRTSQIDWTTIFPIHDFQNTRLETDFIAIGWGDREFYLNTPEWKDLTLKCAIFAAAGQNRSLIHVEYLGHRELQALMHNQVYQLHLNKNQYAQLRNYVLKTTVLDKNTAQNIANYHYDQNDAFFEATGQYSLFKTCNTWIGNGLRQAGLKVSRWTPFDMTVYWYLTPVVPS